MIAEIPVRDYLSPAGRAGAAGVVLPDMQITEPALNFPAALTIHYGRFRALGESMQVVDFIGEPCWIRTSDPLLKRQMLCRLS